VNKKAKGVCAGLEELTDKLGTPLGDEFTSTKRSNFDEGYTPVKMAMENPHFNTWSTS